MAGEPPPLPEVSPDYAATVNGVVFGLFPDRLILAGESIVGEEQLERTEKEMASRNGDFVPTRQFAIADLGGTDFSGADLRRVDLSGDILSGADFSEARLDGASLAGAELQGADFTATRLQGADLGVLQSERPTIEEAKVRTDAGRRRVVFMISDSDQNTNLQGTRLDYADLRGADLSHAQLQGANLSYAQLQGADLSDAGLQGADLNHAQLEGAELVGAQLQGANFQDAQLQGADLGGADAYAADLTGAFVYRTDVSDMGLALARIGGINSNRVYSEDGNNSFQELTEAQVNKWLSAATALASDEDKSAIAARFDRLKNAFHGDSEEKPNWTGWTEASRALDPNGSNHRRRLAEFLVYLTCHVDNARYVLRALSSTYALGSVDNGELLETRVPEMGNQFAIFRRRIEEGRRNPDKCPGAVGFTDNNWRHLERPIPF